jgi:ribosome recycling factor
MTDSVDKIKKDAEARMQKSVDSHKAELSKIRTGRANVGLLDHIKVDFYGTPSPLSQVGSISVSDARTLTIKLWDKAMIQPVEKAITESDLGLNPAVAGETIRIPIPPLTEERRKDLTKLARSDGENAKIAIRNIRRDSNQHLKNLVKDKEISEDEEKQAESTIQKLTDRYVAEADKLVEEKEKDLMEI